MTGDPIKRATLPALAVYVLSFGTPGQAQLTLEIPESEFEEIENYKPIPVPDPSGGPVNQMFEYMELDLTGTMPEAVLEEMLGETPYDFVDVVWGMEVTGDWTENLTGEGTLQVTDFTEGRGATLRADPERFTGRQGFHMYNARLQTNGDHVFTLSAAFPADGGVALGTEIDGVKSLFEVTWLCHMFEPGRSGCVDGADEYYETDLPVLNKMHIQRRSGGYKIDFAARVHELRTHRDLGYSMTEMSGRFADVRGWVCDRASWEEDPEDCTVPEPFQVVTNSPPDERENVNYIKPGIEVEFNRPVEPDSIEDAFTLTTRDPQNNEIEISGDIVHRAADRFEFFPSVLDSGVRYKVRLRGGPDGVQARDGSGHLPEDEVWQFSTLLNLSEQLPQERLPAVGPIDASTNPLRVHTFQTLRDAPLVQGKPTMTRVYVDWAPHDHIHADWQPDDFEMEVEIDRDHARLRGQYDAFPIRSNVVRIYRQDEFSAEDRRMALHTINAFGWRPSQSDGGRVEVSVQPYDPFPDPLQDAEKVEGRDVEVWDHDPGTLNFNYAVAELGPWADGMPEAEAKMMESVVSLTEDYAVQFLPYRNARGRFSGLSINNLDVYVNFAREPELIAIGLAGELVSLLSEGGAEYWEGLRPRMRLGPVLRFFQSELRKISGRDDYLVVFAPPGIFGEETVGSAVSQQKSFVYTGFGGFDNGVVVLTLDTDSDLGPDRYATGLLHEFGHVMNLTHNPAQVSGSPATAVAGIEGYRLDLSGLFGWNKSQEEGNTEDDSTLVSFMWPEILPSRVVMPTMNEYLWMQSVIERGWRASASPSGSPTRFAQRETPQTMTDAGPPAPVEAVVVTGRMDPDSDMIVLETMMLDAEPRRGGDYTRRDGPLIAEMRGTDGTILDATRFDLSEPESGPAHRLQQIVAGSANPDDPSWWPRFRFVLTPDARATQLIIRHGDTVLARLNAPGGPPRLDLDDAEMGPSGLVTLTWRADGDAPLRYDVAYSPDGMAPWHLLAYRQSDSRLAVDVADLENGPEPTIRVTAHDGFHFTRATQAVNRGDRMTPPDIRLPVDRLGGPHLVAGEPIELLFDTEIPAANLTDHLRITDATGREIAIDLFHHADRNRVSVLATAPIEPGAAYALHLEAGLTDRWGGRLADPSVWSLTGAEE
ncbi:Ig-like domain-containing protein [Roseovarius sp.]|uniref:Ig-like domain-containing protein n=1 Tax=Roseovarius sp. TaxID=1486281 RepID=UPI0035642864